jgi:hypothetical protein
MSTFKKVHMKILSVTVTTDSNDQSTINVDPHDLKAGTNEDTLVVWHLLTPGWCFPTDGISFPDDPNHEVFKDLQQVDFDNSKPISFASGFYCLNKNKTKQAYSYFIKVQRTNLGTVAIRQDPTIQNQDD